MRSPNTAPTENYDLSPDESHALLVFLEDKADEFKEVMAHGAVSIEMETGRIISIFTYSDLLDCLAQLRSGATSITI
jgi:hypothetical protein